MPQTDIEVIFVDDGSSDDTVAKAETYRHRFHGAGFRILTQDNTGGPSVGRNRIMSEASGDYIFFVDVDDYLGPEALEAMWRLSQEDSADLVLGKFVGVNRGVPKYIFRQTQSRTDIRTTTLMDSMNVLKMFRTAYIRELDVKFDRTISIAEDHPVALAAYSNTDRVAIQADSNCYFAVRHDSEPGKNQHLTGHGQKRHASDFFAYMHASFAELATASSRHSLMASHARGAYWNRLLTHDIPNRLIQTKAAESDLSSARTVVSYYGANAHVSSFGNRARVMLHGLLNDDPRMVLEIAKLARQ